jgi:hypothetical protein
MVQGRKFESEELAQKVFALLDVYPLKAAQLCEEFAVNRRKMSRVLDWLKGRGLVVCSGHANGAKWMSKRIAARHGLVMDSVNLPSRAEWNAPAVKVAYMGDIKITVAQAPRGRFEVDPTVAGCGAISQDWYARRASQPGVRVTAHCVSGSQS